MSLGYSAPMVKRDFLPGTTTRSSPRERCASELERIVEEFGRVPATPTSSES